MVKLQKLNPSESGWLRTRFGIRSKITSANPSLNQSLGEIYRQAKPYLVPILLAPIMPGVMMPAPPASNGRAKIKVSNLYLRFNSKIGADRRFFQKLTAVANDFDSDIHIFNKDRNQGNLKNLASAMGVLINRGEDFSLRARGKDALEAIAAFRQLFSEQIKAVEIIEGKVKTEFELKGIPVYESGKKIVFGTALVLYFNGETDISRYPKINIEAEAAKRDVSVEEEVSRRIDEVRNTFKIVMENLERSAERNEGLIYTMGEIINEITALMRGNKIGAREAIEKLFNENGALKTLRDSKDEKFKTLYTDVYHTCLKMLAIKHKMTSDLSAEIDAFGSNEIVLIVKNISPDDVGVLNDRRVTGLIREEGSRKDHVSLCLKDKEKGCVLAVSGATLKIKSGDRIIIDGRRGAVIVDPSPSTLRKYEAEKRKYHDVLDPLKKLRGQKAITKDKQRVRLMGNIKGPEDMESLLKHGLEGVGLVRTEFFFINKPDGSPRKSEPEILEQIEYYNRIIYSARGREIIFRTIDPDKDKIFPYFKELNNLSGNKGLSVCLDRENNGPYYLCFRNQIKALLQTKGRIKVMFPLVRSQEEFMAAMSIVDEVRDELRRDRKRVNNQIKFGIMIEHPDILRELHLLAKNQRLSFASIGTNDLTHFITIVDRYDPYASRSFDELDPAVLQAIFSAANIMRGEGKEISLCGDMGNDWRGLLALLGMGIDKISFNTGFVDQARKIILSINAADLQKMFENVKDIKTSEAIRKYIGLFAQEMIRNGAWPELKELLEKILLNSI